jgi:hypothetical protein
MDVEFIATHQEGLFRFMKDSRKYAAIIMDIVGVIPDDFSDDEKRESKN